MALNVNDILKVVAVMQWVDGEIAQNVFNVLIESGTGPFDELDVVDDMEDWLDDMYANLTTRTHENLSGSELRVYKFDSSEEDWDEVGSGVWGWTPSDTGEELPRGVAALINTKSLNPDVNGKKYLPGASEPSSLDGIWTTAHVAQLVLFALDWTTDFVGATSGATFAPGIWSVKNLQLLLMAGTSIIPTIPAYQRRRKQGVGI